MHNPPGVRGETEREDKGLLGRLARELPTGSQREETVDFMNVFNNLVQRTEDFYAIFVVKGIRFRYIKEKIFSSLLVNNGVGKDRENK